MRAKVTKQLFVVVVVDHI